MQFSDPGNEAYIIGYFIESFAAALESFVSVLSFMALVVSGTLPLAFCTPTWLSVFVSSAFLSPEAQPSMRSATA